MYNTDILHVVTKISEPLCLSPSGTLPGLFTDWRDAAQLGSWRRVVAAVASRYVGRYGVDVVKRWRWEGWDELQDEPDHHCNTTRCKHVIHRTSLSDNIVRVLSTEYRSAIILPARCA